MLNLVHDLVYDDQSHECQLYGCLEWLQVPRNCKGHFSSEDFLERQLATTPDLYWFICTVHSLPVLLTFWKSQSCSRSTRQTIQYFEGPLFTCTDCALNFMPSLDFAWKKIDMKKKGLALLRCGLDKLDQSLDRSTEIRAEGCDVVEPCVVHNSASWTREVRIFVVGIDLGEFLGCRLEAGHNPVDEAARTWVCQSLEL